MKYTVKTICLLLFVLIISCNSRKEMGSNRLGTIRVPLERNDAPGLFDSIFEMDRLIILQTTDESLIRRLGKVAFYQNNIYLLDTDEKKILAFDSIGRYLRQYTHVGQGPGEYLSLTDFTIKEDILYLLDRLGGQLLSYSLEDSLLQTEKVEKAKGICVLDDHKYALNMGLGAADKSPDKTYYSYACFDNQNSMVRDIPYNKELCGLSYSLGEGGNSFYCYDDSLFTFFPYNDTVYHVDKNNGELSPYVTIRIGDEQIGMDDDKKRVDELRKKISCSIFGFYKWDDRLLFSYYYAGGNRKYVMVNKNNPEKVIFAGAFGWDKNKIPVRAVAYDSDRERLELLSITYPFEVLSVCKRHGENSPLLKELAGKVAEDGNPVLVFYNLRK